MFEFFIINCLNNKHWKFKVKKLCAKIRDKRRDMITEIYRSSI